MKDFKAAVSGVYLPQDGGVVAPKKNVIFVDLSAQMLVGQLNLLNETVKQQSSIQFKAMNEKSVG